MKPQIRVIKHKTLVIFLNTCSVFSSVLKLNKNSEANSVYRTALVGVFIYTFYLQ